MNILWRAPGVQSLLRRFFAVACILALVGIGVYGAWLARPDVRNILTYLAATLTPATAYTFGYFRCLPGALGAVRITQERTPWQQWSDFARLSAFVAICLALTWVFVLPKTLSSGHRGDGIRVLLGVFLVTSLMAGCVVASEEYLAGTMARGAAMGGSGWRASARRLVGRWGAGLVKPLRAKRSLSLGSGLALASLILDTTVQFGCNGSIPHRGYEIVSGRAAWVTAESVNAAALRVIVAQAGRWAYVLGLVISVATLAAVLAGSAGDALRRSRPLMVGMGGLGLFFICDYTFAWARFVGEIVPEGPTFAIWMVLWLLPVALWLGRARGDPRRWEHTRLAVMILYLPIFFASFYWLVFLAPYAPGYISFVVAMLLLWWGLVQSQWEVSGRECEPIAEWKSRH